MPKTDPNIKKRITILAIPVFVLLATIWVKLIYISAVEGAALRAKTDQIAVKERAIEARRGNIYSADGKLLAISMPMYDLYMDPVAPAQDDFDENISGLAQGLAKLFPETRNARQWENYIRSNRKRGDRYIEIEEHQTYSELQKIKNLPLFNLGKYHGGLITDSKNYRQKPLSLAGRTIGYDEQSAQAGLEGYFSAYLEGHAGQRMMQKIGGGNWKPLNDNTAIEPEDGHDIYTTLDTRIQDVAHRSLLEYLTKYEADHGSVIVMETATGRIKAMANLGLNEQGEYVEQRNYAVWEATEPGSVFKLPALMVAIEDGKVDTADIVDTEEGIYTIYGKKVRDSNVKWGRKGGYGKINVAEAFRKSSNTGIVKAVYGAYKDDQEDFVDELYSLGLHRPTGVTIKGESKPTIPKPSDANWSGITLPWMAFGYGVRFTPLQLLTFYNAIANNGTVVKPQIVNHIMHYGRIDETFEPEVLNSSICSHETLVQLQALLKGVVERGTARNIYSKKLPMAGKTGTCQINYWKGTHEYQASFAGYFPADDPKYSCIVVVSKPNYYKGYYGSLVAAPVFKAIAEEVYLSLPEEVEAVNTQLAWKEPTEDEKEDALQKNYLPNLYGLSAMEAISLLENRGITVKVVGTGKVKHQYPKVGTALKKNMTVELALR